jgi:hypothetical protein
MITAEKLQELTTLSPANLTSLVNSNTRGVIISDAKFIGITNGGQFCYKVVYNLYKEEDELGKVFVSFNHFTNVITADL